MPESRSQGTGGGVVASRRHAIAGFPPQVSRLDVVLTSACNLRCAYCFEGRKGRETMTWRLLRRGLDTLVSSSRRDVQVAFSGGEPLLAFDLVRRAVHRVEGGTGRRPRVSFSITTNGTLVDRDAAAFLARHSVRMDLSHDGVPSAQRLRGEGTHARLDALLRRLARDHPRYLRSSVAVSLVVTSATVPRLAASVAYLLRRGLTRIDAVPVFTHDPGWDPSVTACLHRQLGRVHDLVRRHYEATGEVPFTAFRKSRPDPGRPPAGAPLCHLGSGERLTLDPRGLLTACPTAVASVQDLGPGPLLQSLSRLTLGHLDDPALAERLARLPAVVRQARLFDGRERKRSVLGRCADCAHAASCGVCPVSIAHVPGNDDPDRVPESQCAFFRTLGEWRERFPLQPHPLDLLLGRAPGPPWMERLRPLVAGRSLSVPPEWG